METYEKYIAEIKKNISLNKEIKTLKTEIGNLKAQPSVNIIHPIFNNMFKNTGLN